LQPVLGFGFNRFGMYGYGFGLYGFGLRVSGFMPSPTSSRSAPILSVGGYHGSSSPSTLTPCDASRISTPPALSSEGASTAARPAWPGVASGATAALLCGGGRRGHRRQLLLGPAVRSPSPVAGTASFTPVKDEGHRFTSYRNLPSPQLEQSFMPNRHINFVNSRVELLFCGVGGA
jgi:hypothetical protein